MEEAIGQLHAKDTKERMAGVERLQTLLEQSRKGLSASEVGNLVDASLVLLKDNNFRVSQGTLQALASAAALAGEHLKLHFNSLLPVIVERLGDGKQPVRDAGRRLLLALMEISSPTIIVERAGNFAWAHKNWRVREEFARTVASAINLFAATEIPFQRLLLPSVLQLFEDSNSSVREAAMLCLEEMYRQGGSLFREEIQRHQLRPAQLKDISSRFDKIDPAQSSFERTVSNQIAPSSNHFSLSIPEHKTPVLSSSASRRISPKLKVANSDTSSNGGDSESGEKPVDPVRVYSEKELTKEIEKAASLLTPDQDWSVRIAVMLRIEGLIAGGATEYSCFIPLMKQLVGPLSMQLADRRSSIVKQACHLLNLMSRELRGDFEIFAESFIPVLCKLVVITVLVIAESADTCIKTMLRNCRVGRVLPKLMDSAKHDRNAVLRARCCEYTLLVLEQWGDSPEIQRSVDLYEELIKTCVGDAMSEVRSSARTCYRVFSKRWPDRAVRMFFTFDTSVQRLLNEEGGFQKRYASPAVRDRGPYEQQPSRQSINLPVGSMSRHAPPHASGSYSAASANAERSTSPLLGLGSLAVDRSFQMKSVELGPERSLESTLQASQQQVNAIENMLRAVDINNKGPSGATRTALRVAEMIEKTAARTVPREPVGGSYRRIHANSFSNRVGVDPPSAHDPPYPASAPASSQALSRPALLGEKNVSASRHGSLISGFGNVDVVSTSTEHILGTSDPEKALHLVVRDADESLLHGLGREKGGIFAPGFGGKRVPLERHGPYYGGADVIDVKGPKRVLKSDSIEKGVMDFGMPGFQRPLLRQSGSVRSSGSSRSSIEDNPVLAQFNAQGEIHNYMEGLMSLTDALSEGLSVSADWSARVAAFTFLKRLLQQGPKGLQEITQSFSLVMKLFSAHLDDPHHKVAQAALATLAELIPVCRKPFESYLERILPHVFARLVDAKEVIRQLGTTVLEIVGNTYNIDSLLPSLLRSLDEQRSPKAKIAVIEFAIAAFAKLAMNGEASGGSGLLKLWLAKLGPLANDRNPKLKESAVTGIISFYSHVDSTAVLNFILGLSIEEQSLLRRSLKQYTPRIEVDLMTYLQNRSQRARSTKSMYDHSDAVSTTQESYTGPARSAYSSLTGNQASMGYSSSSLNSDYGKKSASSQADGVRTGNRLPSLSVGSQSDLQVYRSFDSVGTAGDNGSFSSQAGRMKQVINGDDGIDDRLEKPVLMSEALHGLTIDTRYEYLNSAVPGPERLINSEEMASVGASPDVKHITPLEPESQAVYEDKVVRKTNHEVLSEDLDTTLPNLLHQMTNSGGAKASVQKQEALQQLLKMSSLNDTVTWSPYFNQLFTIILESLDDTDMTIKELALSVILEMLGNQRDRLFESTEILLERLLHSNRDPDLKVCSKADRCLAIVLTEFDPYRCLAVVVPLLSSEDDITLVTCIGSLTKLVSRLPSEELMTQLPSFLPALFDAFGNQNADVRKTVVFCLVDIYIVLGKAFVPYLGSLSSTQLRLVTIYANRISQARTGSSLESPRF